MIIDCYRLAKFFGQMPDAFLEKPLSEIKTHMRYASMLTKEMGR